MFPLYNKYFRKNTAVLPASERRQNLYEFNRIIWGGLVLDHYTKRMRIRHFFWQIVSVFYSYLIDFCFYWEHSSNIYMVVQFFFQFLTGRISSIGMMSSFVSIPYVACQTMTASTQTFVSYQLMKEEIKTL